MVMLVHENEMEVYPDFQKNSMLHWAVLSHYPKSALHLTFNDYARQRAQPFD